MVSVEVSPERRLDRQYAETAGDPEFADVLLGHTVRNEDDLADLIELDGRKRLSLGRPIELRRYLDAVPDLESQTAALDAAIDMTLRSLAGGGRPDAASVATLVANYPHLEGPIREAAMLGRSMVSTTRVHRVVDTPTRLPAQFGPRLRSGEKRYVLRALLGAGSSGAVYRAEDRVLSEPDRPALVAVKIMRTRSDSAWARQRFAEEAAKARRINHPNVARVLDRGTAEGDIDYIVYEYIEGGDLAWSLAGRTVSPAEAAALVAKVARGVHAAHTAGLVHCDLKPENILLTPAGEPKVTDFGVAVRAGQRAPERPPGAKRRPICSLGFVAPEQFRLEEGALGTSADVYALGGLLYYLLTGRFPNGDSPEEAAAALDPHEGRTEAPSPRRIVPGLDRDLDAICRRAMAPAPGARHPSAADLAADLEAWLRHEPIYWMRPSLGKVVRLWARRRPWVALLSVALVAAVLGGSGVAARLWGIASARAEEAKRATATLETSRGELGRTIGMLRTMSDDRISKNLLPPLLVMEWMGGSTVLGSAENRTAVWRERVRIVSGLLEEAARDGRQGDVETLMWQSALAFWLVCDRRPEEAEPLLEANIGAWEKIARPGDAWPERMRAVRACARVQRLAGDGGVGRDGALHEAEESLLASEALFTGADAGTPMHRLVLETLAELYGPGMLDRPEGARRARDLLARVAR